MDVRPDSEGYEDLMLAFDLEGSLMSAEATLWGAKERRESRGAHQRSDFKEISPDYQVNFEISLSEDQKIKLRKKPTEVLSEHQRKIIDRTPDIDDFEGMLLE